MIKKKSTNEQIYEQTIKPLFQDKKYGLVSDLIQKNSKIKNYMSKEELRAMMNYYENTLYTIVGGLDKLAAFLVIEKLI